MNWKEKYKNKLLSAEDAAGLVKSGDYVQFTLGREAYTIGSFIARRKDDLQDVKILQPFPGYDFGWYEQGWEDSFRLTIMMPTAMSQQMVNERRCDIAVTDITHYCDAVEQNADIVITEVSPPDEKGYCSFGASLWDKKEQIKKGRLVLAEVNDKLIRTYGDNFVHVSEIDYLVEHRAFGGTVGNGTLAGRGKKQPEPYLKQIAQNVSTLIRNGDTLQMGVGRTTEPLIELGMLDNKCDLGWHSEATPPGVISLVRQGVINGKFKTVNPGKVIVASLGGASKADMEWVNNNPLFWLYSAKYIWDVRVISTHDNMVAINNALSIDLTGQITAESIGRQIVSSAGGQASFAIGALYSKGGRSIVALPSTAKRGTISRIVPLFKQGTTVTIPRTCADYVVTEFGIAHLRGKSLRCRAEELINIAHPDFSAELAKEAKRLYWP